MSARVLFHGTSTKFLPSIKKHAALLPRERTGRAVYSGELASKPDRVYLTDVYAVQFGLIAVGQHGGNLLVCRSVVDDAALLPDDDFQEGGKHRLRFESHEWADCLAETGCVSLVGAAPVDRIYIIKGKLLADIERHAHFQIQTGFMHRGLKKHVEDYFEGVLWQSDRKTLDNGRWVA